MKKLIIVLVILVGISLIIWFEFFYIPVNKSRFTGPTSPDDPLPDELIVEMENYVRKKMKTHEIPGVAMVFVKGDQVVYKKGLGVVDFETTEAVTANTLFGIGSVTKPVTAVVIGSMVDDGVINWDTKLKEILPSFALPNKDVTDQITFQSALCMCSGVPRRMEEISVRYEEMSAEDIIESLAKIPLVDPYGEKYNYSSRMVSTGGYIAAMAAGGEYGNLHHAYETLVQERLFDPLSMTSSTFSIEQAVASGNYAHPHYTSLSGTQAIPTNIEGIFTPIAPAGAMWSNAEDMSKFLVMLLNDGTSADGEKIISPENLAYLWEPRVEVDSAISYGLGWNIQNYHGLTVYFHPGGTVGFASELVVIPELDIGFALMTNQLNMTAPIGRMATYRLLEMLTGVEQVYDHQIGESERDLRFQLLQLKLLTRKKVNPEKVAPFLGKYHNSTLGDIELVLHEDNSLWVDFGEYESSVRPLIIQQNQYIFFESVFVGKTLNLNSGSGGRKTIQWAGDEATYIFTKE